MEHAGRDLPGSYSQIFRIPLSYHVKKHQFVTWILGVIFRWDRVNQQMGAPSPVRAPGEVIPKEQ